MLTAHDGPVYLLAGGHGSGQAAYVEILRRIYAQTGSDEPRVAYVGAATDDSPEFFAMMRRLLEAAGQCHIDMVPLASPARGEEARALLEASEIVFMGGGDVELGMKRLCERDIIPALAATHGRGTPFAGISAGAIMLGRKWVRWTDPNDDSSAELFDCLGFADLYCDTHGEAEWEELEKLLELEGSEQPGYGIRTNAALRIDGGAIEVLTGKVDRLHRGKPRRVLRPGR